MQNAKWQWKEEDSCLKLLFPSAEILKMLQVNHTVLLSFFKICCAQAGLESLEMGLLEASKPSSEPPPESGNSHPETSSSNKQSPAITPKPNTPETLQTSSPAHNENEPNSVQNSSSQLRAAESSPVTETEELLEEVSEEPPVTPNFDAMGRAPLGSRGPAGDHHEQEDWPEAVHILKRVFLAEVKEIKRQAEDNPSDI